jgi:hypothetical protein
VELARGRRMDRPGDEQGRAVRELYVVPFQTDRQPLSVTQTRWKEDDDGYSKSGFDLYETIPLPFPSL